VRDEALKQIIRLKLGKIQRRIAESHRICLDYDDLLLNEVAGRCTEVESGARKWTTFFEYDCCPISRARACRSWPRGKASNRVVVSVKDGALTYAWDVAP